MCVVEQPVDRRGGECFGHERVESGWVDVAGDRDRAPFVGGVDDAVERLGGVLSGRQHAYVVELCRARHRSTYADTATMPRACSWPLVGKEFSASTLGIVTGFRGTRGACPTGGSGPAWP